MTDKDKNAELNDEQLDSASGGVPTDKHTGTDAQKATPVDKPGGNG